MRLIFLSTDRDVLKLHSYTEASRETFCLIFYFLPICAEVKLYCSDQRSCLAKGIYEHALSDIWLEHGSIIFEKSALSLEH